MDESDMKESSETEEREKRENWKKRMKANRRERVKNQYSHTEIIDAIRKSEEKMENPLKKTDEEMDNFLQTITDSAGTQLLGMISTIVKMKEEDDRYNQILEKTWIWKMKILDIDEKCENRCDEPRGAHGDQNQGKAETSESEVIQLLKETIT